jgi:hypothetical protein
VAQDYAQARHWFQLAAQQDYPGAQYNLGVMALGQGGPKDAVTAYQWFRLVQLAFYPGGGYNINKVAGDLTPAQRERAEHWVRQWVAAHR